MSKWTNEEIIEGNELIAEFDIRLNKNRKKSEWFWNKYFGVINGEVGNAFGADHLKYHKSFNWSMPVLQKLSNIGCIVQCVYNLGYTCHIWKSLGKNAGSINIIEGQQGGDSPELATFKAVVQFLKEYNGQK